ncbi:MAG TPA: DNA mismatch repair endonuclease MutL [Terriglobales bacterium]|jgi:DNA mismatch repair protein MutL|nr:DNA mismatch repair endonuclease MutL [Terriglobales bacterium]
MGRIHVLPEHVANKIAAGEVVERPASVVKELLENALDAGARRIRVQVEAGGKKLIQITDDGCGMVRDDALLAFERHATSKIRDAEDLLNVSTLGFRGEALPSIASVSRLRLETCAAPQSSGTVIEIAGGKIIKVEEAGLPAGTSVTVRDLFFNTPARKKFLKAESTELSHIASLVTHYALAHPDKHFELHSATNAMLVAAPVTSRSERIYQVFGKETLDQLLPIAATARLEHVGLPEPPPWRRGEDYERPEPGEVRVTGFVSRPEIQKLNRNSIFVFVNGRLIRDRLMQHALTEAYRNILPPTVFPVVLMFLELPAGEVDVNVHPSKTEVRFRQQGFVHDFVRDSVRAALMKTRPVPQFTTEIHAQPTASQALSPPITPHISAVDGFSLEPPPEPARNERLQFGEGIEIRANAAVSVLGGAETQGPSTRAPSQSFGRASLGTTISGECGGMIDAAHENGDGISLASLAPLGQLRDSFILAVNDEGLWIIDQHVAHERVLFERVLRQRAAERVERQQLLMPLIIELTPSRQAVFSEISDELRRNGFEVEPFGARTIAVKASPAGVDASDVERMLHELLDEVDRESQAINLERVRARIAASIACHSAIKVNTPLERNKMEWLLKELARTECPMSCPHGRPVLLRYSVREIQKAFKRI